MVKIQLLPCRCGCKGRSTTSTGWKFGHWLVGFKRPERSDEYKAKISLGRKGKGRRFGKDNPMFGKDPWNKNEDRVEQALKVKTRKMWRHLLGRVMRTKKTKSTISLLGYSAEELKSHLEKLFQNDMSWDNHGSGKGKWNIDHIKPICKFSRDEDPAVVNALSNLRPLWFEENMARLRNNWVSE